MKKIILKIDDGIFADLESSIAIRGITGSLFGTLDEFMILLIKAVRDGKETITIIKKKNKKSKKKKRLEQENE